MRAEKTRKGVLDADNRKMLPKHDFESVISDDAALMRGLFWNPVEVANVAWRELLNKLSAVSAICSVLEQPSKKRRAAAAADDDDE